MTHATARTAAAARVLEYAAATTPSPAAAAGLLLRGAVTALDAAGRPEGRALVHALEAGAALIGPGGVAAMRTGDYRGALEALAASVAGRLQDAAVAQVRRRFERG
jgi:hypothetical protein